MPSDPKTTTGIDMLLHRLADPLTIAVAEANRCSILAADMFLGGYDPTDGDADD